MSLSILKNTYTIFFENLPNIQPAKRLVRMRQLIDKGLGDKVEVLESFVIPIKFKYSAFIIVKSERLEYIETAIEPAKSEFKIEINKSNQHSNYSTIDSFTHCILHSNTKGFDESSHKSLNELNDITKIHSAIKLSDKLSYNSILLVNSKDYFHSLSYCEELYPESKPLIRWTETFTAYLEKATNPVKNEIVQEKQNLIQPNVKGLGIIHNQDINSAFYNSVDSSITDLRTLIKGRKEALTNGYDDVQTNVHFWEKLHDSFNYRILWKTQMPNGGIQHSYEDEHLPTNAPIPSQIKTVGADGFLSFNLPSKQTFHFETEVGTWLHDIINTKKYNEPWPREQYSEDEMAAYQNILAQLKAQGYETLPSDGFMFPGIISNNVNYSTNIDFKKEVFDSVKQQLINECIYITQYSNLWFGASGLFHALTMVTNAVSQAELTAVASLMNIPQKKSMVMIILNDIIGDIMYVVSAIPGEQGPIISAIINLLWSTVRTGLKAGEASNQIQVEVAGMADEINKYLGLMIDANSTHLGIINGNWGKLREFSLGCINGKKINPQMFGMEKSDKNPTPPGSYVEGVAKAWRIICYKNLFPAKYNVNSSLHIVDSITPTKNRFDRLINNNVYSYTLNCRYLDTSDNIIKTGFLEILYKINAPKVVLDDLFNPEKLNLNPIEFYIGYNGWPRVPPGYDIGMDNDYGIPASPLLGISF